MLTFRALELPEHLDTVCSNKMVWQVCQCFEHGINLRSDSTLLFLSGPELPLCPFGLHLREKDMPFLLSTLRPGMRLVCMKDALQGPGFQVLLSSGLRRSMDQQPVSDLPAELDLWLKKHGVPSSSLRGVFAQWSEMFFQTFHRSEICWENYFLSVVGYGPGLTPSGDDFLVGLLWVHAWYPFLPGVCLKALRMCLSSHLATTLTARNYYHHALEGRFSDPLLQLGTALCRSDWKSADKALSRLLALGHSSGQDTWAGIGLGMRALLKEM